MNDFLREVIRRRRKDKGEVSSTNAPKIRKPTPRKSIIMMDIGVLNEDEYNIE